MLKELRPSLKAVYIILGIPGSYQTAEVEVRKGKKEAWVRFPAHLTPSPYLTWFIAFSILVLT